MAVRGGWRGGWVERRAGGEAGGPKMHWRAGGGDEGGAPALHKFTARVDAQQLIANSCREQAQRGT